MLFSLYLYNEKIHSKVPGFYFKRPSDNCSVILKIQENTGLTVICAFPSLGAVIKHSKVKQKCFGFGTQYKTVFCAVEIFAVHLHFARIANVSWARAADNLQMKLILALVFSPKRKIRNQS